MDKTSNESLYDDINEIQYICVLISLIYSSVVCVCVCVLNRLCVCCLLEGAEPGGC